VRDESTLEDEIRKSAQFEQAYKQEMNGHAEPEPESLKFSDTGNAQRLVNEHGTDLHYCYPWKQWLTWQGKRWMPDESGEIFRRAKKTARAIATKETEGADDTTFKKLISWSQQTLNEQRLQRMVKNAQSEPGVAVLPDQFDCDPWLLNCENGTLDLHTSELRKHRRSDFITKLCPVSYDPAAQCPLWEAFVRKIFDDQADLIWFMQKALGSALTGDTREEKVFLLHGVGANGKTTLLETFRTLLNDYARQADFTTFLHKDKDSVRTDLARLRGARFVSAVEAEQGRRLAEVVVKQMTGQDTVTARQLFQAEFEYKPVFKLFLAANHRPVIRGTDEGIWRRICLIPFSVVIPKKEQDKTLGAKLTAELPCILNWALFGCRAWQEEGLEPPDVVSAVNKEYRDESDMLGNFIAACCELGQYHQVRTSDLHSAYVVWSGDKQITQNAFGRMLTDRGYPIHNQRWRKGLRIISESELSG
jgi:putative DNA primase/helicase